MWILAVLVFCFFLIVSPVFRCAVRHPLATVRYGATDVYYWVKHKKRNLCGTGLLVAYVGLFGKGKTLSAVHTIRTRYLRYNGKTVWCPRRKKFVRQVVRVMSNVTLDIPYEPLESLQQVIDAAKQNQAIDDIQDTLTVTLVLGDEFSVQMNSRNFKNNVDPLFLNTLLTCRHYHIAIYYTAQRFGHVDALLRQVTSYVVDCNKLWRFQRQNFYDAWEMENCTNPLVLTAMRRSCWFVRDEDYNAYDTYACVGQLERSVREGDMLTPEEILALQNTQAQGMDAVAKPSKRWRKARTKK